MSPSRHSVLSRAGQCRTNPWPAVSAWPCCRNPHAGLRLLTTGRNADAGLTSPPIITVFRHLLMNFQHHIARITTSAAVCGRGEWITFYRQQYGRAAWVYLFPPPLVWSCRVYPFPPLLVWTMDIQGVSFPTPAVWSWKVYLFPPLAVRTYMVYPCPEQTNLRTSGKQTNSWVNRVTVLYNTYSTNS